MANITAVADQTRTTMRMRVTNPKLATLTYTGPVVYFISSGVGAALVKIGMASNLKGRLRALQTGSPFPLQVFAVIRGGRDVERGYHEQFVDERRHGEWFARSDALIAEVKRLQALPLPILELTPEQKAQRRQNTLANLRAIEARMRELDA